MFFGGRAYTAVRLIQFFSLGDGERVFYACTTVSLTFRSRHLAHCAITIPGGLYSFIARSLSCWNFVFLVTSFVTSSLHLFCLPLWGNVLWLWYWRWLCSNQWVKLFLIILIHFCSIHLSPSCGRTLSIMMCPCLMWWVRVTEFSNKIYRHHLKILILLSEQHGQKGKPMETSMEGHTDFRIMRILHWTWDKKKKIMNTNVRWSRRSVKNRL